MRRPTVTELGRERFGADYLMSRGEGNCRKCGKPTLYGRHLGLEGCTPCEKCEALGIASHPCIHDLMREGKPRFFAYDGVPDYYDEIDVWLGGLPVR